MVDKIYYAAILSVLTGLVIWAIKAFVGNALASMTRELKHVKDGVDRVENGLVKKTQELKSHFEAVCTERQQACSRSVNERVNRMEKHGHRGLTGDDNRHTY